MAIKTNINGTWKDSTPYVNVNGVFKPVQNAWVNVGGAWKLCYSAVLYKDDFESGTYGELPWISVGKVPPFRLTSYTGNPTGNLYLNSIDNDGSETCAVKLFVNNVDGKTLSLKLFASTLDGYSLFNIYAITSNGSNLIYSRNTPANWTTITCTIPVGTQAIILESFCYNDWSYIENGINIDSFRIT